MLARLATNLRHRQAHGDAMGDGTTVVLDQNCAVSLLFFSVCCLCVGWLMIVDDVKCSTLLDFGQIFKMIILVYIGHWFIIDRMNRSYKIYNCRRDI